ncbi:MAG: radical SAM protein [Candidatus Omnitrophota bacterium]
MNSFFITNKGCPRRALDAERIKTYLIANNQKIVDDPRKADYIFVVSCGLKWPEEASIETIKKFKNLKGEIIVCGCLPEMNPKKLNKVFNGRRISTAELDKIDAFFPDFSVKFRDVPDANIGYEKNICKGKMPLEIRLKRSIKNKFDIVPLCKFLYNFIRTIEKIRKKTSIKKPFAFENKVRNIIKPFPWIDVDNAYFSLRISEGCLGNCSYCTIRKAIGRLKSKPMPVILEELRKSFSQGNYKLNIQSSDSGSYGLDIGTNLPELLNVILKEDKKITFEFIQDLHPHWLCTYRKEFIKLSKAKKIKSILTAFQSGSSRILKLMNRSQNMDEYIEVLNKMKEVNPRLRLRTQVIVGFPTETEKDFEDTLKVIREVKFDQIDIFQYYETELMHSTKICPKVPRDIIAKRLKKIEALINK